MASVTNWANYQLPLLDMRPVRPFCKCDDDDGVVNDYDGNFEDDDDDGDETKTCDIIVDC